MTYYKALCLSLLFAVEGGTLAAQTQSDSTRVKSDSVTWNKELDGIVVKAQRPRPPVDGYLILIRSQVRLPTVGEYLLSAFEVEHL